MTPKRKFVLFAIVAILFIMFFGYWLVDWLILVRSHATTVRSAHRELHSGMSVEDVSRIMGDDDPLRFKGAKIADVLSSDEADRCVYTLAYTNPYYLDPAIYCYFDAEDKLIAAHCFD